MTVQNKKTGQRQRYTSEEWESMRKPLESDPRRTYQSLFKVIDTDDSSPLDEQESAESSVPEILKSVSSAPRQINRQMPKDGSGKPDAPGF